MTKTPIIIFDFGNVLIDWNPRYLYRKLFHGDMQAVERFLEEVRFNEWNHQQDAGRPFEEAVAEACSRHPQYCELLSAYPTRYEETLGGPIWGTVRVMNALKLAGYTLYGLSNWPAETFQLVRQKYAFFSALDGMVISGEVKLAKPDPRIFQLLLEKVGHPAQDCLLIDDALYNIEAAQELGFKTLTFRSPEQLHSELIQRGLLRS